jgi:hypothetical protein
MQLFRQHGIRLLVSHQWSIVFTQISTAGVTLPTVHAGTFYDAKETQ